MLKGIHCSHSDLLASNHAREHSHFVAEDHLSGQPGNQ
ncbi:MAG: hypothetical protein OJF58_003883 [Enhydrobacter sp.]|nr:MAG: hypothetical protein OJF58_003883 [Enhydrobacter sp.]